MKSKFGIEKAVISEGINTANMETTEAFNKKK